MDIYTHIGNAGIVYLTILSPRYISKQTKDLLLGLFSRTCPPFSPGDFHVGRSRTAGVRSWPCPRGCRARPLCCQPSSSEPQPCWLRTAAGQGCEKRPGEAGEGSRGWPRAQPPARPARRSRPAPSAPAGGLTPILLRKHLLGFKVTRPPFRHGENKARASPQHASGWLGKKVPQKQREYTGRNPTGRRDTACAHCAPAFRPSRRSTETSWPAAQFP